MKTNNRYNFLKNFFSLNRRIHIHFGLFILLFIWLYFISGLIIHHGEWKFAKYYDKRKESKTEFVLAIDSTLKDDSKIALIKEKLKLKGESDGIRIKPGSIDLRISSPGLLHDIHLDTKTGNGTVKMMQYNFWGKLHSLHLFNGMNKNDPSKGPNWYVTKLWRFTMDITAIILIILCAGSWIMWFKVRKEYRWGYIFLGAGLLISGYFLFLVDII